MTAQIIMAAVGSLLSVWLAVRHKLDGGPRMFSARAFVYFFAAIANALFIGIIFIECAAPDIVDLPPFSKTGITFYPKVKP